MGTLKRTNEDWRTLITDQRNSGLSQATWCAANSINIYTFRNRASRQNKTDRKLKPKAGQPAAATAWMEIVPERVPQKIAEKPVGVSIECGGFVVTVNTGFDAGLLAEVLRAVSLACC